jgi:hypothetical protein
MWCWCSIHINPMWYKYPSHRHRIYQLHTSRLIYDTLRVLPVFPCQVVSVSDDFELCFLLLRHALPHESTHCSDFLLSCPGVNIEDLLALQLCEQHEGCRAVALPAITQLFAPLFADLAWGISLYDWCWSHSVELLSF